jgi:hypothetical protein
MADWVTISSLATAGGTLVLAVATFASVRSANRAARVAERSLMVGLRPVLMPSRDSDVVEDVLFGGGHVVRTVPGRPSLEVVGEKVYMVLPLRNVGAGLAVLQAADVRIGRLLGNVEHRDLQHFHPLRRGLYVAPGDVGYWQRSWGEDRAQERDALRAAIAERTPITVDLLYADHEGGQRTITRFVALPGDDGGWVQSSSRHWTGVPAAAS